MVEQYVRSESDHDSEGALGTFSENARDDDEPWEGEEYIAGNKVRLFHEQLMKALPDLEITVQGVHTGEDAILAEVIIRGTHLGAWYGFPATGRRVEFPFSGAYMFDAEDRLTGEGICDERGLVLRQFGVFHEYGGQI